MLLHGAQSRGQLAARLGLSAPTLTRAVRPLLDAGILWEAPAVRTADRGRSALPLDVAADRYRFLGVKLTEESIHSVVTDLRAQVLHHEVAPVVSLEVDRVVEQVGRTVTGLQERSPHPVSAVGVTVGGQVEAGEVVADSPFLHWQEVPLRALLAARLDVPVHVDNDVVGLTRAQHWFGHGRGLEDFALLTIGAGIGYGLVVGGTMVPTSTYLTSHLPLDPGGPPCPEGHRGCATASMSSPAVVAAASAGRGRVLEYDEVLALAEAQDPLADRVVREAAVALGRTASTITALTGVEHIILSGEGVHLAEVAGAALDQGLTAYSGPGQRPPRPLVRPMDFMAWARGAAVVAIHAEFPDGLARTA